MRDVDMETDWSDASMANLQLQRSVTSQHNVAIADANREKLRRERLGKGKTSVTDKC